MSLPLPIDSAPKFVKNFGFSFAAMRQESRILALIAPTPKIPLVPKDRQDQVRVSKAHGSEIQAEERLYFPLRAVYYYG